MKHLVTRDLWPSILIANNLESADEVRPGVVLNIPVFVIKRAYESLEEANVAIREAVAEGAQLLASEPLDRAIELRNASQEARQNGEWDMCHEKASQATELANRAKEISIAEANAPGEAEISYRLGNVDRRRASDLTWIDAPLHTELYEGDKVRTLSSSLAEILFQDESRLRLEENSEALIQEMRTNRLNRRERSTITLMEGDFLTLLSGRRTEEEFQLSMGEIETDIRSSHFYVSSDDEGARFSNYQGEIEISAEGSTVVIEENEGSFVAVNQAPSAPRELLPRPALIAPSTRARINPTLDTLRWANVANTAYYRFEIAADREFSNLTVFETRRSAWFLVGDQLAAGVYYWRVSAVDDLELVGPTSEERSFTIVDDREPPFLMVQTPVNEEIVTIEQVEVRGETEAGAAVFINDVSATVYPAGGFSGTITLSDGWNDLVIRALDEAQNETRKEIRVRYASDQEIQVVFDPSIPSSSYGHFLNQGASFTVRGTTGAGYTLRIQGLTVPLGVTSIADASGTFEFTVPTPLDSVAYMMNIIDIGGRTTQVPIFMIKDNIPPVIQLEVPFPNSTSESELVLSGVVQGGENLSINDTPVELENGRFYETVELRDGSQRVRLVAYDLARNVTVIERDVILDREAPELVSVRVSPQTATGPETVTITMVARDDSGLNRTAQFTLVLGDFTYNGYLRLGEGEYTGTVNIPEGASGRPRVSSIILQDQLGNARTIER